MRTPGAEHRKELNADRRRVFGHAERSIAFVCECGDSACARTIVLTPSEYDAHRRTDGALLAHDELRREAS